MSDFGEKPDGPTVPQLNLLHVPKPGASHDNNGSTDQQRQLQQAQQAMLSVSQNSARRSLCDVSPRGGGGGVVQIVAVVQHRHRPTDEDSLSSTSSDDDELTNTSLSNVSGTYASGVFDPATVSSCDSCLRHINKLVSKLKQATRKPQGTGVVAMSHSSFWVLSGENPFRILMFNLVRTQLFEGLVLATILLNCVMLALDDPTTTEEPDWKRNIDIFVLSVFTLEMLLKFISQGGALHPGAYFRSGWNWLDFFIVALAYIKYIPGVGNFTAITVLRALRPLRSLNAIPQLKAIVKCLAHSIKGLVNVFVLALFMYSIFAIFAVQLWMGNFKTRCFFAPGKPDPNMYCTQSTTGSVSGASCPAPMFCDIYENPNGGISSFDNFGAALLVVFQCVTLESWSVMMYIGMDTCGWPAAIYFILVVVFCSYFVLNLALAVISFQFVTVKDKMFDEEIAATQAAELEQRKQVNSLRNHQLSHHMLDKPVVAPELTSMVESEEGSEEADQKLLDKSAADVLDPVAVLESQPENIELLCFQLMQTAAGRLWFVRERKRLFPSFVSVDETFGFVGVVDASTYPHYGRLDALVERIVFVRRFFYDHVEGSLCGTHCVQLRDTEVARLKMLQKVDEAARVEKSVADVETTYFSLFIYFCIFANMVVLAIDRFDAPESQEAVSKELNFAFTVVFGVEMLLRIVALGPVEYCTNVASLFDGCVTFISIIELSVLSGSSSFSVLRAFRMLRVLRLFRAVPALRAIMEVFILALRETGYLNVIFLLYFLIASLIGMQIFGDVLDSQNPKLSSFSSFLNSFYTVVQIITFDSWPDNMWIAMQGTGTAACVYFICCVLIGNFVILNLLLAILINSFNVAHDGSVEEEEARVAAMSEHEEKEKVLLLAKVHYIQFRKVKTRILFTLLEEMGEGRIANLDNGDDPEGAKLLPPPTQVLVEDVFGRAWEVGLLLNFNVEEYTAIANWQPVRQLLYDEWSILEMRVGEEQVGRALVAYTRANVPQQILTNGGNSLGLFGPRNQLRVALSMVVSHPSFEWIVLTGVILSSVSLAVDNPRQTQEQQDNLDYLGNAFTIVFTIEALMKIIVYNFYFNPTAYLRDSWNVLDFIIVVVSLVSWALSGATLEELSALKILRTLRVLRPLRLINKNRGLRMIVMTVIQSIKGIASMALVAFLIFLIFSILAVQLFGGRLYSCNDPAIQQKINCVGKYNVTVEKYINITNGTYGEVNETRQRFWVNRGFNYDNTGNALVALLHMATLDNWGAEMYWAIGATDHYNGNVSRRQTWVGLFFVIYVIVAAIFVMNMFVGVIIYNFAQTKDKMDGLSVLTNDQKLWVETQRMVMNFRPQRLRVPGSHPMQQFLGRVVMDPRFDAISGVAVLCNIIVIALDHDLQKDSWESFQVTMNFIFTALFVVEAAMKLFVFEKQYFNAGWNQFDFFIVSVSVIDLAITGVIPFNVGLLRVLRVFRIMRVLALVRRAKDVRILLETLWYSIPSLANIGAFLCLVLFVFSVLGVQLFSLIPQDGVGLTPRMNFENFGNTFLFLIQLMTFDNWGATMLSVSDTSLCGKSFDGDETCGTPMCVFYFFPFVMISGYVMVNLFIAIILDNFETTMELDKSSLKMNDLKTFLDAWASFDPDATMVIPTSRFPMLLAMLKPPLGIERAQDRRTLLKLTKDFVIPEHGGLIHFVETLIPLARQGMKVKFSDGDIREHEETWKGEFPDLNQMRLLRYRQKRVTVDQYFAATYIAAAHRRRMANHRLDELRTEKAYTMLRWYENMGVPESDRQALHLMHRREKARQALRETALATMLEQAKDSAAAEAALQHRTMSAKASGSMRFQGSPEPPVEEEQMHMPKRPSFGQHHGKKISLNKLLGMKLKREAREDETDEQQMTEESKPSVTFGELWATHR